MEQDIEKENKRLRDLLYSKIMFIEQLKEDYRNLVKDIEEITKNYNEARDLAIELRDAHETVRKEFLRADKNKDMWREKTEKLQQILQEIKAIAECVIDNDNSLKTDHCFGHCGECSSFENCKLYPYWKITHLITKAED